MPEIRISIIAPAYNESENIPLLCDKISQTLGSRNVEDYEILIVDDGSTDGTFEKISEASARNSRVKGIRLKRNYGQTAAISTGIANAHGDIVVTLDADLQNDPEDIPALLEKIEEGYDVVSGWRYKRKDRLLTKVIPSKIANLIISLVSGIRLKDYGCTLKAYRLEYISNLKLYGEMHRFLPIYAYLKGANITELRVKHHPRKHGKSHYGLTRIFKVILDLLVVKFIKSFFTKPVYFFGGTGLGLISIGALLSITVLVQKYAYHVWAHKNPLLTIAIMLYIIGFQFILFGVLAEIIVRIYFEVDKQPLYRIDKKINL